MSYCGNCGSQLSGGQKFCAGCGAPVTVDTSAADSASASNLPNLPTQPSQASTNAEPQNSSEAALQKLATLNAQSPPPAKSSGKTILIAILVIFVVGGIAAVGGVVYLGYRVKQRASATWNKLEDDNDGNSSGNSRKVTSDDAARNVAGHKADGTSSGNDDHRQDPLSSVLDKLQGGDSTSPAGNMATNILEDLGVKNPGMPPDLVRNIPYSALATPLPCPTGEEIDPAKLAGGRIQIKPGTILTTSWSLPLADAESSHIIESASPSALVFEFNGVAALGLDISVKSHPVFSNTVCGKDVVEGEAYSTGWTVKSMKEPITPGLYPGVSRILLAATKFNELKSSGSTKLVFAYYAYMDVLTEWALLAWKGTLARVEPDDIPFPLIINDERVDVPSIHVRGNMKVLENAGRFGEHDQPADAYILDDANTPVVLSWMFGKDLKQDDSFRVQYIRVRYPSADKPTIEQQLATDRKATTWGINFDFNSDVIRPESEPVLKEIAQAMADKPDWRLTIAGHTDNIGGDKYNLALSQRRSAAVKKALAERYHADANRLSTAGYGDSVPIDTNGTLEGRARNRRVELTLD
jgi:outer membrane protein OmpA-like peptidoglycan-associated protein